MRWSAPGTLVWLEALGLGWAGGLALFTSLIFAFYVAGVTGTAAIGIALLLALVSTAVGMSVVVMLRRRTLPDDGGIGRGAILVGLTIAGLPTLLSVWMALSSPLAGWDGWAIWAFKARMFAMGGPATGYFHDHLTAYTHPDYPLNLPLAEAALFHLPSPLGVQLAALLGPTCMAVLILLFYIGLIRLYGGRTAALATGILAAIPALPRQAAAGYADVPLTMYLGAATLYLLLWWRQRRLVDAIAMGVLAGGAIWTKNEGLSIAVLLALFYGVAEIRRRTDARSWQRIAPLTAMIVLPIPWLAFSRLTHPVDAGDFLALTPATVVGNLNRLPEIIVYIARQMADWHNWSLFWVVLTAALLISARRLPNPARGLLALLLLQLAIYVASYMFSSWRPYTLHIETSEDRLLLQSLPLALLLLIEEVRVLNAIVVNRVAGRRVSGGPDRAPCSTRHSPSRASQAGLTHEETRPTTGEFAQAIHDESHA